MTGRAVLVFDVNETLLDLSPLAAEFDEILGEGPVVGEWFARLLHGTLVANSLDAYRPFNNIAVEALKVVATRRRVDLDDGVAQNVVARLTHLRAHPEVFSAMERLFDAGYRIAALTNGSTKDANEQIENAGLHIFFQRIISVEEVRAFKPDPRPYRHTAEVMDVAMSGMVMVAAHDWDVAGAAAAGCRTVFVNRPGSLWSLPGKPPGLVAPNLSALAEILVP
jgi:2-haloacid dehalogenase